MSRFILMTILVLACGLFPAMAQDAPTIATEQAVRGIQIPPQYSREALINLARGTALLVEDFTYTSGSALNGQGGWTAHSGAGTNAPLITTGGLTYTGYAGSGIGNAVAFTTTGEDNNRPFASFPGGIAGGSLYYAFLVNLDSAAANGDYFFHLLKTSTTFTGRVFARRAANGNIRFGIAKSSTAANVAYSDSIYTTGTTYLLAIKYTVIPGTTNDTLALWVNPAIGGAEPTPTVFQSATDRTTADVDTVYGVALRQGTASNAPIGRVDGIRVATTWEDAVAPSVGGLTGTKTVGGTTPDYASFTAAVADLVLQGVGPGGVLFNVRPGVYGTDAGTEADTAIVIPAIAGASAANQITFKKESGTVVLERSGSTAVSEFILLLNGADWFTFDGIDFRQRTGGNGMDLPIVLQNASATDGAQNNTFKNFVVTMSNLTNTAFSAAVLQTVAFSASTASGTNSYNKFYNFTITGPAHGFQLFGTLGMPDVGIQIGTTSTASSAGAGSTISYGSTAIFNAGIGFGNQDSIKVFDVEIVSGTQSAAVSLYGIAAPFAGSAIGYAEIYNNRVHGMAHTGTTTGNNRAISVVNTGRFDIYNNVVYDISHATTSSGFVAGISIEAAADCRVYNNFVSDIKAPTGTGTTVPTNRGISLTGGNIVGVYYNTVYLDAPNSAVSRSSAAFYVTITPFMVDYRNNIFINKSAPGSGTTGRQAAFTKSTTALTNLAATSNNNLLYAGPVAGSTNKRALFYPATGTGDTTLAQYKSRMAPFETAAATQDVAFVNTTTPPYDLHVNSAVATHAESGGNNVPGITTDIDGQTRVVASLINNNVAPDIGADEFSGTAVDEVGPSISYTPLGVTLSTGDRTLDATIKDLVSGVHTGTGLNPRMYYKKNGGSTWTSPQVDSVGVRVGDTWTFTIAAANIGGLAIGDTVYYYVAASDSSGNISTNPTGGSGLPPGSTPPPVTNFYRVNSSITGTMTIGATGATFTTVKAAFDSVNGSIVLGAITFLINADYAGESVFPISLNAVAYGPGGPFTITLKPNTGATPTISGTSTTSIIRLNGADNVIIDGSNSGGSTRDLTITNTSTAANTAAIWLSSLGAGAGAENNVIKNLNLACGVNQSTSTSATFGIIGSGATISATVDGPGNNNNTITNNYIIRARFGIHLRGAATEMNNNNMINNNLVGPTAFGPDEIGSVGITIQHQNQATVTENEVRYVGGPFALTTSGADRIGIGVGSSAWPVSSTTLTNSTVTRNLIHHLREDRTFSAAGIVLGSTSSPANNVIANNMIHNLRANATPGDQVVGIGIGAGSGDKVVFNSILITGPMDTAGITASSRSAAGIVIGATTVANLTLKNNISYVDVTSTTTTLKHYSVIAPATTFSWGSGGSDNNDFFINTSNTQMALGGIGTANPYTDVADLAAWRTQFTPPQDANSISADPLFVDISGTDLHIRTAPPSPVDSAGTPIAGVTNDYDGDLRNATTPDIGADEYTQSVLPPPVVSGIARNVRVPSAGDTTVVTCTIVDTLGITSANLLHNINGTQNSVPMVLTGGTPTNGTYRGVIPGSANADGNRIEYRVQANSLSGASTTTAIVAANSYYAGISPLSLTGLRRVNAGGKLVDSLYYARVTGTVNGPNFQTTNLGYHFQDAVGGIQLFSFGQLIPPLNLGDSIIVTGRLAQFRGLTEIIPDTQSVDVQVVATGRTVTPITVTVPAFNANPELYESRLVHLQSLRRRDATPPWPAAGGSANIVTYQGAVTDTIIMRVDGDTEIPGSPEPSYPVDVKGVISQFSSATSVYNNGYQTQPRYLTDFTPPTGPLLFEQFESGIFPPTGWSTYIVAGDSGWRSATTAPFSGTTHAFNRYNPAGTLGSKFLVTRRINVPADAGAGTYELSFWARRAFTTPFPPDTVYVKISTTDSLPASFGPAIYKCYTGPLADTATNPDIYGINYRRFKVNITGITGTLFIAFDHQDNDGQTIYLDDVKLEEISVHDIGVANVSDLPADQPGSLEPPATSRTQQAERAAKASIELAPTANKNGSDASFEKPLIHFVTREANGTVTLEARVANYGSFVENSYQVGWTIDGVAQPNVNNTQPLEIGDVDTVSLSWASPTPGTHTARAWTILAGDVNAANDTSAPFVFEVLPDNIIYEETFADTTIPAGWLVVNNDGSPGTTTTWQYRSIVSFTGGGTVLPQAGNRFWFASYTGANGFLIDEWLISPQIPAANFDTLYFYAGAVGGSFPDSLKVKVSTTGNNVADFVHELGYFRIPGPIGAWHRFAVPLTQFRGQNIYFAINYYIVNGGPSGTNSDNVWADHPFITGAPIGFFDDFEAYTVGQQLVVQNPTDWSTWSGPAGTAEDPFISSAQAFSGTKSVVIVTNNDLVKRLGNDTTGTHEISFKFYVPSGKAGYFNTLATFTPPSTFNWGMEAYFDSTGNGRLFAGSATAVPFTYTRNAWQTATVVVNLTIDSARFVVNGNVIRTWRWTAGASGGTSPKRLAANDFYGATAWDQMFMDNYSYRPGTWTGVGEQPEQLPETFVLMQNYPNPFNPTTTIQYALPSAATVSLRIYNLLGQEVATLVDESQSAGYHTAVWNGRNQYGAQVATGVYFYRIEARSTDGAAPFTALKKMLLVK